MKIIDICQRTDFRMGISGRPGAHREILRRIEQGGHV